MTQNINLRLILIFSGALFMNFIFWKEGLGLNMLLFTLFLVPSLLLLHQPERLSSQLWAVFTGLSASVVAIFWSNTGISKAMLIISFIAFAALCMQPQLRKFYHLIIEGIAETIIAHVKWVYDVKLKPGQKGIFKKVLYIARLAFLPTIIIVGFLLLYSFGNQVLGRFLSEELERLGEYIAKAFRDYPFVRFIFILACIFILSGLLLPPTLKFVQKIEDSQPDDLTRTRSRNTCHRTLIALKKYYLQAIIVLTILNVLLFANNAIDIIYLIFSETDTWEYSALVHEGVYTLSASVLLGIAVLLYFFSGNLNFYPHTKKLHSLAYTWLLQNGIIIITIAAKNYLYIAELGLTYKRIGVFLFLLIMIGVLWQVFQKVHSKKTISWVIGRASWAVYFGFLLLSFFRWDAIIANHNLNNTRGTIDYGYLLELSPQALPVLLEHEDEFRIHERYNIHKRQYGKHQTLQDMWTDFYHREKQQSLLSWNLADYHVREVLIAKGKLIPDDFASTEPSTQKKFTNNN